MPVEATPKPTTLDNCLEALGQAEARFQELIMHSVSGILVVDQAGIVQVANPAALAIFGRDTAAMVGKPCTLPLVEGATTELTIARPNGKRRVVEMRVMRTEWRGAPAHACDLNDISAYRRAVEVAHEQRTLAEALRDTAATLASTLSLDEVLDRVLVEVGRILPHDASAIWLIKNDAAQVVRSRGYVERGFADPANRWRLTISQTADLRTMLATGQPSAIGNTASYAGWVRAPESLWVRSIVEAPIRAQGRALGFLSLSSKTTSFFNRTHAAHLQAFADQVGLAIENARLFSEMRERARQLDVLARVSTALRTARSAEELAPIALEQALGLVDASAGILYRVDPATGDLVARGWYPPDLPLAGLRHRRGEGAAWHVIETGEFFTSDDVQTDPRVHAEPTEAAYFARIHGGLALPLRTSEGHIIGVMQFGLARRQCCNDEEVRLLSALSEMVANALSRAELLDTLEQRVAERTAELSRREAALQEANTRLTELDRLKGLFVSNVSHELRTPLANIKNHLYLVARGGPEQLPAYLATLNRETDLLHHLIEDLLQLSRLDQGKVQPTLAPLDLNELVRSLAGDRESLFVASKLTLKIHLAPGLPRPLADRNMLAQVLTNLMTNAMNYTPAGGRVTVATAAQTRDARPWITFSVRDSGPGMSAEDQAHLFERFYRGSAAHTAGAPGTGLGLAICHEIVERLGGQITIESQPGHGCAFTVWLAGEPLLKIAPSI